MPEDSKFLDVILEALLVGWGGGGVRMSLAWISNTVVSHFEEKAMSLSVVQPIFMSFVAISFNTLLCNRLRETLPSGFPASVYPAII